jgi:HEAT repeat protein
LKNRCQDIEKPLIDCGMDDAKSIIWITLLLLGGCSLTAPANRWPPSELSDPFLANINEIRETQTFKETGALAPASSIADNEPGAIAPGNSSLVSLEDLLAEPEESAQIPDAEQAELLTQNIWVKNIALINWLDSGKTATIPGLDANSKKRSDEINRLNMSNKELAKKKNQKYEYATGMTSNWRWMHRGVDQLLTVPTDSRTSPEVFLRDEKYKDKSKRILRANAAILMGRDGDPVITKYLLKLVQNESYQVNQRCAAAETLGRMPNVTADDLISLLDLVKEQDIETIDRKTGEPMKQHQGGIAALWEELLVAISEKMEPWEHPCFLEPFSASSADIRLETAKIWRQKSLQKEHKADDKLPEAFLEFARRETNTLIRVEIIKTLGAWREPNLFKLVEHDLNRAVELRNAAMNALADARCEEAIPLIKDKLRDSTGVNRAAAVESLRKLGCLEDVFKQANDDDQRVRIEVAKAFADQCSPQTATLAKNYLTDHRYEKVQTATVEAIASWAIEDSGPLFLEAAKSTFPKLRQRATEILTQNGVSAERFDPADLPKNQTEQYQELVHAFYNISGVDPNYKKNHAVQDDETGYDTVKPAAKRSAKRYDPNDADLVELRRCLEDGRKPNLSRDERVLLQKRLTAFGKRLLPLLDSLDEAGEPIPASLDSVLAQIDPVFEQIRRLNSDDVAEQRRGAVELAKISLAIEPPKLVTKRMMESVSKLSDPMVLTTLVSALKNADPELVCRMAKPMLHADSPEIRRLSCEMYRQFGSEDNLNDLEELLHDSSRTVVRGALQAIDSILQEDDEQQAGKPEGISPKIADTLQKMLSQSDPMLQTDVAATLHRIGKKEGTEALRRLSAANDNRIKSYVAKTVSGLNDPAFVPLLIRYLDDPNGSVRNEALKALPLLAGEDIGNTRDGDASPRISPEMSPTQQQIARWKFWSENQ